MSLIRQRLTVFRPVLRNQFRLLSTTPIVRNQGPIDAAKDLLKKADRVVSDAAVTGIEKGRKCHPS